MKTSSSIIVSINLVKESNMKEIHFYTNLTNEEQTSEWDLDTMVVDLYTAQMAIADPRIDKVKTTQVSLLRNAWDYIAQGKRVFIHNGSEVLEVEEHMKGTEKDIRIGHDLSRLLLGGTFGEIC